MRPASVLRALTPALLALGLLAPSAGAQVLNQDCVAVVLNRTAPVTPDGMFVIANVPLPIGSFRARVVCQQNGQTFLGATAFVQGVANGVTNMGGVTFGAALDPIPVSLSITSPAAVLVPGANGAQLVVTGTLVDGSQVDFTLPDTGTRYTISNTNFATIKDTGFVTAVSSGVVTVTAVNEGVVATIQLRVEFDDDTDGDGIPDDYEMNNSTNPGGSNLARLAGTMVHFSSQSASFPATRVIDGNLRTSWFTNTNDAANRRTSPFIEIETPTDVNVAQIRMFGNREQAVGFDFFAGRFLAFDANGNELFNSGRVVLPPPDRDVAVALDLDGVRRVRFVATEDESPNPGLSEIELISRPGGPGLDKNDPDDAALDFDGDGLTNLEEFNRGTSPFLNDTDGDRVTDAQEILDGSDPTNPDTDNDGLLDGNEVQPLANSDNQGPINLLDPDSDNDGLLDGVEVRIGLDPTRADSNSNGTPDNAEDTDADGIPNLDELAENLDPGNPDTDGDGLKDGEEVVAGADGKITDPLKKDTDGDGMLDGYESNFGLDPTDPSDAAGDADGDGLTNLEESQLDTDPKNPDRAAPNVMSVDPADGAIDVLVNKAVVIQFSEAMRPTSLNTTTIQVLDGDVPVGGTVTPGAGNMSATFRPTLTFDTTTEFMVVVSDVRDAAGNLLATRPFTSTFTTSNLGDLVRPNVVGVSPPSNADGMPVNSVVQVTFDEPIDPATVTASTFAVTKNSTGVPVPGALTVDPSGLRAFFTPSATLAVGTLHRISLTTGIHDLAGNLLSANFTSFFTTGFAPDTTPPTVLGTDPADGATGQPINTVVTVDLSEPLDPTSVNATNVSLTAGVTPMAVPASLSLLEGNKRIRVVSSAALASATPHTLTVSGLRDLAANVLAAPTVVQFTTASTADIDRPTVVSINPESNASGVVRDIHPTFRFSEALNPLTVNTNTFFLQDRTAFVAVPFTVSLDITRRIVTLTPAVALEPDTPYMMQALGNGVADSSGNALQFTNSFFFTTGETSGDVTAPTVVGVNPPDASAGVPLNSRVAIQMSEGIDPFTLTAQAMQLSSAGGPVTATFTLTDGNRQITLVPSAALTAATTYTLNVQGLRDPSGNQMAPFSSTFTSSVSGVIDNTGPTVSVVPPNGATGVSLTPSIVFTFSEPLNPISVTPDAIRLGRETGNIQLPITVALSLDRTQVTVMPTMPLQPLTLYRLQFTNIIKDVAGNLAFHFSQFTTTAGTADTTRPTVAMITPANGSTDVAINTPVVITFSEPVDPNTATTDSMALLIDGNELGVSVFHSADNTVAILDPFQPLPAGAEVTVLLTDEIRDLAGNRLQPFVSGFTVDTAPDRTQPTVAGVRPPNGATGVRPDTPVVLFFSEPVDQSTADDAVIIADQGNVVTGTLAASSGNQVEEFTPAAPFTASGQADVFVTQDLADTAGNHLAGLFHTTFTLAADPSTLAPQFAAIFPQFGSGLPRNTVFTVRFSEPMDPATFTPINVQVRDSTNGLDVTGTMSFDTTKTLFRFVPSGGVWPANHSIGITFTVAVKDAGGTPIPNARGFGFSIGPDSELVAPTVTRVSPPDGTTNVGTNAVLRIRFSEPMNSITADASTIMLAKTSGGAVPASLTFSDNEQFVTLVPNTPLEPATDYTITVSGVTDRAGNPVVASTTHFVTGNGPDLVGPQVVAASPIANATGVNTNPVVVVDFSEPVDPTTIRQGETFRVVLNSTFVDAPGNVELEPDGRRVVFTPSAPLHVGTGYRIFVTNGVEDASGNLLPFGSFSSFFTTGFLFDTSPPLVDATNPADGDTNVATNVLLDVRMSESIDRSNVDTTTFHLARGGTTITGEFSFTDGDRRIRFRPVPPLQPGAAHQLTLSGLRDVSGNVMPAPVVVDFTTETSADLVSPTVVSVSPAPSTTDVDRAIHPVVRMSEPLNPLTVSESTVMMRNDTLGVFFPVTVNLDVTRTIITITPDEPLEPGTQHRIQLTGGAGGLADDAGNVLSFTNTFFFTTGNTSGDVTGPTVTGVSPPDGRTSVPVNVIVQVRLSEPIDPVSITAATVRLTAGATPVPATLSLGEGNRLVQLQPTSSLTANTVYTLTVDDVTDVVGNPIAAPFTASFTTSVGGGVDTTSPGQSVVPPDGAVGVSLTPSIVFTFTEPLNPVSVVSSFFHLFRESNFIELPITIMLSPDLQVVTLTPGVTLQPMTQYRLTISGGVRDIAGNQAFHFSRFTTGAGTADTTRPTVSLVSPAANATDVPINSNVVVTFSEPIDPNTVSTETLGLVINAAEVGLSVFRSTDNTVVTLDPFQPLPAGAIVTLLATDEIRDLSGNRLVDFTSTFTVEPAFDLTQPSVAAVRPPNGATNVSASSSVAVLFSEPMAPASISNGLIVANDGAPMTGALAASSQNQFFEFTPATPFNLGGLAEVFVTQTITDAAGNPINPSQSSFRIAPDPNTFAPDVVAANPAFGAQRPRNSIITARFNEPMDITTFTPTNVPVRNNSAGTDITGTRSLDATGTLFRFVPDATLPASVSIGFTFTVGVKDASGTPMQFARGFGFSTSPDSETTAPTVTRVSPPDGTTGVGTNAKLRIRFSESTNPITVDPTSIILSASGGDIPPCSITLSDTDQLVTIVPHTPLTPSTTYTVHVEGVTDVAGNPVVVHETTFQTGPGADLVAPQVASATPNTNSEPLNAIVVVDFTEPVDPATVRLTDTFRVVPNSTFVDAPGTLALEPSGRRAIWTPSSPLVASTLYRIFITSGLEDASGNVLAFGSFSGFFTTGTAADAGAPTVVATNPANGDTGVPTNGVITVQMSEPVNPAFVNATTVALKRGATPIAGTYDLSDGNRRIRLTPTLPLLPSAGHTLTVSGLRDTAGNTLAGTTTVNFTTDTGADLVNPTLTTTPAANATGVATSTTVRVDFDGPMNPITINSGTLHVRPNSSGTFIDATLTVDAGRTFATITPTAALSPNTLYRIEIVGGAGGVSDAAGNPLTFTNTVFFTTGP